MSITTQNNISPFNTPENEAILAEEKQFEFDRMSEFLSNCKSEIDKETYAYLLERVWQNTQPYDILGDKLEENYYEVFGISEEEMSRTLKYNMFWEMKVTYEKKKKQERQKAFEDRFKIPKLDTKKEYKEYDKKIRDRIIELDEEWKRNNDNEYLVEEMDQYVITRKKLKAILSTAKNNNFEEDLARAKAYPIENIIDFNNAGVACCISHQEKTPSMKWYKKNNKAFCFGCQKSFDSIDAYIIINNCSFEQALKSLK